MITEPKEGDHWENKETDSSRHNHLMHDRGKSSDGIISGVGSVFHFCRESILSLSDTDLKLT